MLPPAELAKRFITVVDTARRMVRQVPDESLTFKMPDRDRTLRELALHIFQIATAFLDGYETGFLRLDDSTMPADPESDIGSEAIAAHGDRLRAALTTWWEEIGVYDPMDRVIEAYWGARTLHEALERETWHSAQHTRQLAMFLEKLEIVPDRPLTRETLGGLPLPENVWA